MIAIDVSDWRDRGLRLEEVPQSEEELVQMAAERGLGARETAEIYMGLRAAGIAPDDMLDDDKSLLSDGGTLNVHQRVALQRKRIEIMGREYSARAWTGVCKNEPRDGDGLDDQIEMEMDVEALEDGEVPLPGQGYLKLGTEESVQSALNALQKIVPGHIKNRAIEIAAGGGDVHGALDELIAEICRIKAWFG